MCLNPNVAKALVTKMCEVVSDACLHLSHSELFTSPSLNRYPVIESVLCTTSVNILSKFLLRLSNSKLFFAEVFFF